jgi:hypothetical protein
LLGNISRVIFLPIPTQFCLYLPLRYTPVQVMGCTQRTIQPAGMQGAFHFIQKP